MFSNKQKPINNMFKQPSSNIFGQPTNTFGQPSSNIFGKPTNTFGKPSSNINLDYTHSDFIFCLEVKQIYQEAEI